MSHAIFDQQDLGSASGDDDGSMLMMVVGVALVLCFGLCVCPAFCLRMLCGKGGKAGAKTASTRTAPAASSARRAPPSSSSAKRIRTPQRSHARLPSEDVDDAEEIGEPGVRSAPRSSVVNARANQLDDDDDLSSDKWSLQETRRAKQAIAAKSAQSTKERFRVLKGGCKASSPRTGANETELNQILDDVDL